MGIELPIIPGIMPITNYSKLARFSNVSGAEIPRWIRKQFEAYRDDSESILKVGEEVASDTSHQLLEQGAPEIHFYTMNQTEASLAIWNNIK
jgi:methylenetetrahydrofolate reductase (NADPH)